MRETKSGDELNLGQFLCFAFDHDHMVLCSDIDEIKVAHYPLAVNWVCHELAVDAADADCGNGTREGNVGNAQCRARAVDKENVRIVLAVCAQKYADDLGVVEVTFREKRPKRPIRHAAGENFLLGWATFALEITTWKFADRRRLLAVVDREREEVLTFLDVGGRYCGHENDGFARANCDGAIGEPREFAGFNGDWGLADSGRSGVRHDMYERYVPWRSAPERRSMKNPVV